MDWSHFVSFDVFSIEVARNLGFWICKFSLIEFLLDLNIINIISITRGYPISLVIKALGCRTEAVGFVLWRDDTQ